MLKLYSKYAQSIVKLLFWYGFILFSLKLENQEVSITNHLLYQLSYAGMRKNTLIICYIYNVTNALYLP